MQRFEDLLAASGPPPAYDEGLLGEELRQMLRPLNPRRAVGHRKVRIGGEHDGGYVCVDDFDGVDAVLSFGIDHNISFDLAVADRGMHVHQFDHTVDCPRPDDQRLTFQKKMIAPDPGPDSESLSALIDRLDRRAARPNVFLKIDIEDWEWPVFDATSSQDLSRILQITGEFHAFEFFAYPAWRERTMRVMAKLSELFSLVHVHGNNCAAVTTIGNATVPNVMEMTFLNKDHYRLEYSEEVFPTDLDAACRPGHPDIELGKFRF